MVSKLSRRLSGTLHLRNRTVHRHNKLLRRRQKRNGRHLRCPKCANKPSVKLCPKCLNGSSSSQHSSRQSTPVSIIDNVASCYRTRSQQRQLGSALSNTDAGDEMMQASTSAQTETEQLLPPQPAAAAVLPRKWHHLPITRLPLHIQQRILEYLPIKERVRNEVVCQSWRRLLRGLWFSRAVLQIPEFAQREFNIRQVDERHVLGMLSKCGRYLRCVSFFFLREAMGVTVMDGIAERCANLREFSLTTDAPGQSMYHALKTISVRFPLLELLSISYHIEDTANEQLQRQFENGLRACARRLRRLKWFSVNTFVMPADAQLLFPQSDALEHYSLMMLQVRNATVQQGKYVPSAYVMQVFRHLANNYPSLRELHLCLDADFEANEVELREHLARVGQDKQMHTLSLRISYAFEQYNIWFGAEALRGLSSWHSLQELCLSACVLPHDLGLLMQTTGAARNIRRLQLDTVYSDEHSLFTLITACARLQQLSLVYHNQQHYPAPPFLNTDFVNNLFMYLSSEAFHQLELVDCDQVSLPALIRILHNYMHYLGRDCPPPYITPRSCILVSFSCRYRYRLRQLTHLPVCCVQVRRLHDDVYTVRMPVICRVKTPAGVTLNEFDDSWS